MIYRKLIILLIPFALVVLEGCNEIRRPVVVSVKDFTEQQIIAEIVVQSLNAKGIPAEVDPVPRDSLNAIGALWIGDIDLYIEYTGSGLSLVGHPPIRDMEASISAVKKEFARFNFAWGPLLGFRNDYSVLARPGAFIATKFSKLSELAELKRTLRTGMTIDFRKRPLDGYDALVRHYGLHAEPTRVIPSSIEGKNELYAALLDGEIDLAIGFLTDPAIRDFDLIVLADDRNFFPAYAPAPLTRAAFLERRPEVREAFAGLKNIVSTSEMRKMVARVANLGADPFEVAAEYLDPDIAEITGRKSGQVLAISVGSLDAPAGQSAKVILALRKAFPERHIDVHRTADPLSLLLAGDVRYALVSGSDFFELNDKRLKKARGYADAVAPADFDVMHLLVSPNNGQLSLDAELRLGVGTAGGTTERTAELFAAGIDGAVITPVSIEIEGMAAFREQAMQLRQGALDGLLVMAELGHPMINDFLSDGLELARIEIWERRGNRLAFPFLQPVTIPISTYVGQSDPIESFGSQVVIAAARPDPTEGVGVVGPGSAAIGRTLPMGAGTVARIREALGTKVRLDPSLPIAFAARRPPPERPPSITPSPLGSLINLAAIAVLVLIIRLYLIRQPGREAE